jgi:hypothetical protein
VTIDPGGIYVVRHELLAGSHEGAKLSAISHIYIVPADGGLEELEVTVAGTVLNGSSAEHPSAGTRGGDYKGD